VMIFYNADNPWAQDFRMSLPKFRISLGHSRLKNDEFRRAMGVSGSASNPGTIVVIHLRISPGSELMIFGFFRDLLEVDERHVQRNQHVASPSEDENPVQ